MLSNFKAIIIDDEKNSLETIEAQIRLYCPEIEIVGTFSDAEKGLEEVLEIQPDVAFVDIMMPKLNGLELAKHLNHSSTKIVFITAFKQYAFDAIKLSAIDYILKPIENPEQQFRDIIEKLSINLSWGGQLKILERLLENEQKESFSLDTQIGLSDLKEVEYYTVKEIIRLKAEKQFCRFYFTEGREKLVSQNLANFKEALSKYGLVQVNRSEIANLHHRKRLVKKDGPFLLMSDGTQIDVSPNYKHNLPFYAKSPKRGLFTQIFKQKRRLK